MYYTKDDLKNLSAANFVQYEGIPWEHGKTDCYTFVQKIYKECFGITMKDYERKEQWWRLPDCNLYIENYMNEGFFVPKITKENPLQVGDGFLITVGQKIPVHVAMYVGNNKIIHHFMKRQSMIEPYIGIWKDTTVKILRHKNFA